MPESLQSSSGSSSPVANQAEVTEILTQPKSSEDEVSTHNTMKDNQSLGSIHTDDNGNSDGNSHVDINDGTQSTPHVAMTAEQIQSLKQAELKLQEGKKLLEQKRIQSMNDNRGSCSNALSAVGESAHGDPGCQESVTNDATVTDVDKSTTEDPNGEDSYEKKYKKNHEEFMKKSYLGNNEPTGGVSVQSTSNTGERGPDQ